MEEDFQVKSLLKFLTLSVKVFKTHSWHKNVVELYEHGYHETQYRLVLFSDHFRRLRWTFAATSAPERNW